MALKDKLPIKTDWLKKALELLSEYGWVALILLIIGGAYKFYNDVNNRLIESSYKQNETNRTVGQLEGKVEYIRQDQQNLLSRVKTAFAQKPDFSVDEKNWQKVKSASKTVRTKLFKKLYA